MKFSIALIASLLVWVSGAGAESAAPVDPASAAKLEQARALVAERAAVRSEAAAAGAPESEWRSTEEVSVGGAAVKMVTALGLVLGTLLIGLHIHRKVTGKSTPLRSRRLKLIERLPVSGKTALVLVELDGRPLVLSVGGDRVTALEPQVSEFTDVERLCRDESALAAVGS